MKSYYGAQDIAMGVHSARDCTNESVNVRKIKNNARIKINTGDWEKSTIAVADNVLSMCDKN